MGFNIEISHQNDSLVFSYMYPDVYRSLDGGVSWDLYLSSIDYSLISLSPFNDSIMYSYSFDGKLLKSENQGNSFSVVDTFVSRNIYISVFYYDIDKNHIYRESFKYPANYLSVSNNKGEAYSWSIKYESSNQLFVSIDTSQSGIIYLADGSRIFYSSDYGGSFFPYRELDNNIIGIYKKPNSDKLYAATKYSIYEITNDSISIIKSLPIPEEIFSFYPLEVGNKWVYKVTDWSSPYFGTYSEDIFTREVLSIDTRNNKQYFKIEEKWFSSDYTQYVYERIDTGKGLIYRFGSECLNADSEKVIERLLNEPGDSILTQRFSLCWDSTRTLFDSENDSLIFNLKRKIRRYDYYYLDGYTYTLVSGIGLFSVRQGYDFGTTNYYLNGCVINNLVYGDTTVTSAENENQIRFEFKLSQNYPNPFNPVTVINYQLPERSDVSLIVYDVLGNQIAILVDKQQSAGSYNVDFNADKLKLSSGVYLYRLNTGKFVKTGKMVLLK